MHLKLLTTIVCTLMLSSALSFAQTDLLDSLSREIAHIKTYAPEVEKDTAYINLLNAYAYNNYYVNNDSVRFYAKKSLKLSNSINYSKGIVEAYIRLGFYHSENNDYKKGIEQMQKALAKAKEEGKLYYTLECYNAIAIFYKYEGNIKKTVEVFLKGISIGESATTKTNRELLRLGHLYENLGSTYGMMNNHQKGFEFAQKAQDINIAMKDTFSQGQTLSNMANFQLRLGHYASGLESINKSLDILQEDNKYADWLAFAFGVKGELLMETNKFQEALSTYDQALNLYKKLEDKRGKTVLLTGMAKTHYRMKDYTTAKAYAEKALLLSKEINSFKDIKDASRILFFVHKQAGDYKKALEYHEQYNNYKDSIFTDDNAKSLAAYEAQLEANKKENQLKLENQQKFNKQRRFIYLSAGVAAILLTVLMFSFLGRQRQNKLNTLLAHKNTVLKKREAELSQLNHTQNKFFSILGHDLKSPIASLTGLIELLNFNEMEAKEFKKYTGILSEQVNSISFTLNNLLVWGRSQMKNGNTTHAETFNMNTIIESTLQLFDELAYKKQITLTNKTEKNAQVYADENQITLVFRNLVDNAIKFTNNNGTVEINATSTSTHWQVEVKDNGVGMAQEAIDKALSKETQFNSTYGTNREKGTGLGLNLCKEMIAKNNGKLMITSEQGHGTSFIFTVPKAIV